MHCPTCVVMYMVGGELVCPTLLKNVEIILGENLNPECRLSQLARAMCHLLYTRV